MQVRGRGSSGGSLLRARTPGAAEARTTTFELFFDLVYVFAVTQLSHLLLRNLGLLGAGQTFLLLLAVWWAWMYTTWATNWFDPDRRPVRLMLVGVMLASLIMSATLPEAFGDRGLGFAGAYVVIQVGRAAWIVAALRDDPVLRRNFQRILAWCAGSGVLWVIGGLVDGTARAGLWLAAVAVDYTAPAVGFYTPGLGRSHTREWSISGAHMAERCQLFVIIALGESVLVTGAVFGRHHITVPGVIAFVVAFLGSVALWWVYFDRHAEDSSEAIVRSPDPGRLGRSAYTYPHLPIVAGIIVTAVGDELTIAHPLGHTGAAVAVTVLGGPALFLAGHALFKLAVFGVLSVSRPVAVVVLGLLGPLALVAPPVAVAAAATAVVVGVGLWEVLAGPGRGARSAA